MSKLSLFFSKLIPQQLERNLRDFRDLYLRNYAFEKLPAEIYDPTLKHHSISFCTTCMNRFFHLRKTVIKNMEDNINYPGVEFVVINYNSQDGLHEWAKKNLKKYTDAGVLSYYHTKEPQFFHVCKAKNLAHRAAKGDIVVNVDGDNFTGKDFAYYINWLYNKHDFNSIFHFRKKPYWGTEGRIALAKTKFMELGGYEESFLPTGHEDHDLLNRAKAYGMRYENIQIENFLRYLSNTTKEKSMNFEDENAYYYNYETGNRKISNDNIAAGKLIANVNTSWGSLPMFKNFTEEVVRF
ncbi:glycosyltransferase [Pseudochryseolinea flava]|uniref:Glycosyltransferase 2-like domain-containing protein n=1 Tax=Pseudochryseolinea flava TaxID=2059302 RepID=A0A364Y3G4_9BACT|nr:glycosyltransferase family 2 protein [Pseudochryseolinea flava]RAW01350.1 hypothetical protein DQQ10_10625 [Pseudochryseolinea flava]